MLDDATLLSRLRDLEGDHVERTRAAQDRAKIGAAICAFANDLPGRREVGTLFVGALDDGGCAGLDITDTLLRQLEEYARNGTVVPLPVMHVRRVTLDGCSMAVIEVTPSDDPPVKYDGRVCVRRGPVRAFATPAEERRLIERRISGNLPFEQKPVPGTSIADLDLLRFRLEYLPADVAADVLAENGRDDTQLLRAARFLAPDGRATAVGLLVVGKDPRAWLPGAYIQFVRYPGTAIGDVIGDEKEIGGPLADQFRYLDDVLRANIDARADMSGSRHTSRPTYPILALQELARNAVIHRDYFGSNAPVRITWYADRLEIVSPGGPYGVVTREGFGRDGLVDYRNPALAAAAKAMDFAQRFGSGIPRARVALAKNGNPPPVFRVEDHFVHVTVHAVP